MNLGSCVVLAVVIAIVALAIRATFFKKSASCCSAARGDARGETRGSGCSACAGCSGCPSASACPSNLEAPRE